MFYILVLQNSRFPLLLTVQQTTSEIGHYFVRFFGFGNQQLLSIKVSLQVGLLGTAILLGIVTEKSERI